MSKQPTRRRTSRAAAQILAVGVAVVALVGMVGAGQALAALAPPDERVLERQRMIDRLRALRQVGAKGRVSLPPQLSSEDKTAAARAERERRDGRVPAGTPQRFIRPEPPMVPRPPLDDQQVPSTPVRVMPAGARGGLVVVVVVAAVLLAVGAATTWRVRHRRPQPESTA